MSHDHIPGIQRAHIEGEVRLDNAGMQRARELQYALRQEMSDAMLGEEVKDEAWNPFAYRKIAETLEKRTVPAKSTAQKGATQESTEIEEPSIVEEAAKSYQAKNPELSSKVLMVLLSRMHAEDTAEEVLEKVLKTFSDHFLADEALDFLVDNTNKNSALYKQLQTAKQQFNDVYGREIRAGRNISAEAREFATKGLGSPTALRDLYRDIVANPRDPHTLFEEFMLKFQKGRMRDAVDFLLHSLGADMKSKGPSISRPELERLFNEARLLQAFLGLYRFFQTRMKFIAGLFDRAGLSMPSQMHYDLLARQLMKLLKERYPKPDKILKIASVLGISEEVAAQIIIFSQYRDAMRHLSPKLFQSEKHRQDMMAALIDTISELDDKLEEEKKKKQPPKDTLESAKDEDNGSV